MSTKLRVLVVDDSALMRKLIPQILARDSEIEVVGTAMDGAFGLKKIEDLRPDVVTLDLEMPRMDGLETLRQITRRFRVPVIVVSALTTEGASATFKALALGAFDFVAKPRDAASAHMDEIAVDLISKIKVAAKTKVRNTPSPLAFDRPRPDKKPLRAAARADQDRGDWHFHRRTERAAIPVAAIAWRFSRDHCCGAAHAGRIHGNVCAAAG